MAQPFQQDAARARRRYGKKKKGEGHIGPDGPRRVGGPRSTISDPGKGLRGSRKRRENPPPKRITAGPRPNRKGPQRRPQPGRRPPVNPFMSEVDALAQLQFGPQERQLAEQRAIEAQRGVNQNSWYSDLYQRSLQAAQASQAGALAAQQAAYAQGNQNFATDQAANQGLLQQQNQQAAIRGTATDPMLAQQMQQGAQVRQQQQTQFGNLAGQLGQNQAGYAGARTIQATEQGIQAQSDTQARQRKVESLAQELLADKGAFKVKTGMELQQTAHKQRLENKAFGLDVAQEQFDQQDALADNRRMSKSERRQQREARSRIRDRRLDNTRADRSLSLSERKEQRMRDQDLADDGKLNGSSGGKGKYSQSQMNSNQESYRKARSIAGGIKGGKKGDIIRFLSNKKGVDPLIARAVVAPGTLTAGQRAELRRMGVKPPKKPTWQQQAGDEAREGAGNLF
jgi:hypothetical protein